jgi:antitoxin component of MazEF toxin-antitoxin module
MRKNFDHDVRSIQVDHITGEYYITLPESMVNELYWYEDTEIEFNLDGKEIILSEHKED